MPTITRYRPGYTLRDLLIAVAAVAVLLAVFITVLPHIRQVRITSPRATCRNNLRQIALAIEHYRGSHRGFPTLAFRNVVNGKSDLPADPTFSGPQYPWTVSILPYIEEASLYKQIAIAGQNFTADPQTVLIDDPSGKKQRIPPDQIDNQVWHCPSQHSHASQSFTSYIALSATQQRLIRIGPIGRTAADGVIIPSRNGRGIAMAGIQDGASRTILLTESSETTQANWYHWQQNFACGFLPGDTINLKLPSSQLRTALNFGPTSPPPRNLAYNADANDPLRRDWGPSSEHSGIVMHAFADSSVTYITDNIDPKVWVLLPS